jgi:integrase
MNISLKIDPQNPNHLNEYPLYVRIRGKDGNGKWVQSLLFTELYVKKTHIKNGVLTRKNSSYQNKQDIISSIIKELEITLSVLKKEGLEPSPSLLKKHYLERKEIKKQITPDVKTFWGSFEEFIHTKKHKSRGYVKTLITTRNRLKDFEKFSKKRITFEYVVDNHGKFQFEFQDYLWIERKLSNSYVNKLLVNLSQFLFYCKENRYIEKKPSFRRNDEVEKQEKIYLYLNEVVKLFKSTKWDYSENKDFSKNPHIIIIEDKLEGTKGEKLGGVRKLTNWELVKDIFLFQCSIGCRYSDIPHFKVNDFNFDSELGVFSWIQQKTDKRVNVSENDISRSIFIKYSRGKSLSQHLFPSLSTQKFNKSLKYLLKDLKFNRLVYKPKKIGSTLIDTDEKYLWEVISSHSGRRTFIKNMIDLGTMDYKTIMTMSGHKTFSEFEKYISVSPQDLKKGTKLYKMDDPQTDSEIDELVRIYSQLEDGNKKLVLNLIRNLKQ